MKVLCIFVSLVVAIKAGYPEVQIPLAARTQSLEDKLAEEPEMESRVAGGEEAPEGEHPYLVGLIIRLKGKLTPIVCASSLVNAKSLVTAAHCVDKATVVRAVLGSQYLFRGGTRIKTKKFIIHPLHKQRPFVGDYDIAVVKLPYPVEFTDLIKPINLPSTPDEAEVIGETGVAAGWGLTGDNEQYVRRRTKTRQVSLQIIPETVCKMKLKGRSEVYGNNVCTDGAGRVGVCKGDSGSPLVVKRGDRKILVGVASFANEYCELGYPAGFTRVYTYLDFIQKYL